jgi:hypothetical protein
MTDHTACHADIDRLLTELGHLRDALTMARRVIDPEQHDVIEEIDMALYSGTRKSPSDPEA